MIVAAVSANSVSSQGCQSQSIQLLKGEVSLFSLMPPPKRWDVRAWIPESLSSKDYFPKLMITIRVVSAPGLVNMTFVGWQISENDVFGIDWGVKLDEKLHDILTSLLRLRVGTGNSYWWPRYQLNQDKSDTSFCWLNGNIKRIRPVVLRNYGALKGGKGLTSRRVIGIILTSNQKRIDTKSSWSIYIGSYSLITIYCPRARPLTAGGVSTVSTSTTNGWTWWRSSMCTES